MLLKKKTAAAALMIWLICVTCVITACSGDAYAKKVSEDLDSLKAGEAAYDGTGGLAGMLKELGEETDAETYAEMTEDYEKFMSKVRDFDFEMIATEEDPEEYDESADNISVVEVRIKTYDFGRAYVKTWADHLEKDGDASKDLSEDFDEAGFYKELFQNLSTADEKDFIRNVNIIVTESEKDGTLTTDVTGNKELHDAIMGGLLSEMNRLAD